MRSYTTSPFSPASFPKPFPPFLLRVGSFRTIAFNLPSSPRCRARSKRESLIQDGVARFSIWRRSSNGASDACALESGCRERGLVISIVYLRRESLEVVAALSAAEGSWSRILWKERVVVPATTKEPADLPHRWADSPPLSGGPRFAGESSWWTRRSGSIASWASIGRRRVRTGRGLGSGGSGEESRGRWEEGIRRGPLFLIFSNPHARSSLGHLPRLKSGFFCRKTLFLETLETADLVSGQIFGVSSCSNVEGNVELLSDIF